MRFSGERVRVRVKEEVFRLYAGAHQAHHRHTARARDTMRCDRRWDADDDYDYDNNQQRGVLSLYTTRDTVRVCLYGN